MTKDEQERRAGAEYALENIARAIASRRWGWVSENPPSELEIMQELRGVIRALNTPGAQEGKR
jgi:hypothetical protein